MFDFYVNIKLRDLVTKIRDNQKIKISCNNRSIYIGHCPIFGDIPDDIYVDNIFIDWWGSSRPSIQIEVNKLFTIERGNNHDK
jgi:hypothetical protein